MAITPEWNESLLKTVGRWGLALLAVFALFILSAFPFTIPHLGEVRPAFLLCAVYYATILRPPPLFAVFLGGLLFDLISGYTFGLSALLFVLVEWLTLRQRKFLLGQPFLVIWAGFALVALGAGAFQWGLFSLFNLAPLPVKPVLISTILSSLLFPLIVMPIYIVYKALSDDQVPGV
jgi:rod shape-determining protein MreD